MRDRVLVWGLSNNRAGTEAVISNYASRAKGVLFDYLCYENPVRYNHLLQEAGGRAFVIPIKIKHPIKYYCALRSFFAEHGHEYYALWFNINDMSNIDLLEFAAKCGIERRITHFHNDNIPDVLITKFFSRINRSRCLRLTTDRWACSTAAGRFAYGDDTPFRLIPNAVDANRVSFSESKRKQVRDELCLADSFVIGNIGRFAVQKNQQFLIRLMPAILKTKKNAKLLLVGEGELREDLVALAARLGVEQDVLFAGTQEDVQGYLSAMDVFAFPSLYEGFGLSLLEAQFNKVPCIVSSAINDEVRISSDLRYLELDEGEWVSALLSTFSRPSELVPYRANQYDLRNLGELSGRLFMPESD